LNNEEKKIKDLYIDLQVLIGKDFKPIEEILAWRKGTIVTLEDSKVNVVTMNISEKKIGEGRILRNDKSEMDLEITNIYTDEE